MIRFDDDSGESTDDLFQVASMVDVVFILLSFFVLSVQFHGSERDLALDHADAQMPGGAAAEDFPSRIVVTLSATETGAVGITIAENRLADDGFDELTALLNEINLPSVPVTLIADPRLSIQQVVAAMDGVLASPMKQLAVGRLEVTAAP